jgi:hypothetical protein
MNKEEIVSRLKADMERNPTFAGRVWSDDYVRVWIAGEIALGEFTRNLPSFESKFFGDGGEDSFVMIEGRRYTINVKTSKKPYNLVAEPKRNKADIYCLARYFVETDRAVLLGWQWGSILHKTEPRKLADNGVPLHTLPQHELRDMQILQEKIDG